MELKDNNIYSLIIPTLVILTMILMLFSFLMYIKALREVLFHCSFLYILIWTSLLIIGRKSIQVVNYSITISILSFLCSIGFVLDNPISLILMYFTPMIGYMIMSPFEALTEQPFVILAICLIWNGSSIFLKKRIRNG